MDEQLYRDIILEHWKNPQNYGVIENADIQIRDHNPLCGDSIELTLKVNNNTIEEIKFTGEGCAISIASASILTEYSKKKRVKELQNMPQSFFLNFFEIQLTPARLKCAVLSYVAMQKGLRNLQYNKQVVTGI